MSFRETYLREHATTRKVLHAFPADQTQFKPHERSVTAHHLGWTFVIEEQLMEKVLRQQPAMGGGFPPDPATWQEVLDAFDQQGEKVAKLLESAEIKGSVTWFTGPKQTGEYSAAEYLWFMLHDQIHHRGQMSVYLRMAGGKVPSIYGPSADEPWF
ncbi:MAG TPA: DinB family protein [Thermoanaerobaculia bacterium]|nr:DinB family protein [Thermoanaerobaculia bacterium]